MVTYEGTIRFTTDRPLTEDELDILRMTLFVMVDEPTDAEGENAEWKCVAGDDGIHSSAEVTVNEVAEVSA